MLIDGALVLGSAAGQGDEVAFWKTLVFAGLLVGMILSLAFEEKIHAKKSVIVGVFAVVSLMLGAVMGLLPFEDVGHLAIGGHDVALPVYVPGVDWGVIAIILGSGIFVDVTSKSGLFTWIAIKLTKGSKGDPLVLLWLYGLMTVVFSAVLNNVTAMIIVGSLTAVSLGKLGKNDKLLGFLMVEGLLTNVGGLLTLISSVPNIIVGQAAGISFAAFFIKAAPYVVVATVVTVVMGAKLFGIRRLKDEVERGAAIEMVAGFDEKDGIESWGFFWFGVALLVLFISTIAAASVLPYIKDLGIGYVAMAFGLMMLLRFKAEADRFYQAVDWDLLAFFVGLFVTINVMEHAHVLGLIGQGLAPVIGLGETLGAGMVLVLAAVFSSVTDNIPLAAMLAKIMAVPPEAVAGVAADAPQIAGNPGSPFWWSVIFGANLGGNLTPIGSASTLVAVTIMHKHELAVSFARFVKMAIPYALVQIGLAVGYVLLVLG